MTPAQWEEANAAHLSRALAWLRARLESSIADLSKDADAAEPLVVDPSGTPVKSKSKIRAEKNRADAAGSSVSGHAPIDPSMDPPAALAVIATRFGLTPFESDVLLLCVGFELDTRIAGLCARAHDDPNRAFPTFGLALTLFSDATWDVTSLERPLRRWSLVDVERRSALPLALSPLHSDARTVDAVKGFDRIDERLSAIAFALVDEATAVLPPSHHDIVERIAGGFSEPPPPTHVPVELSGSDRRARVRIASAVAAKLARRPWQLNADWLPTAPAEIETIARLWEREALLAPTLLIVDLERLDDDRDGDIARAARRLFSRLTVDTIALSRAPWPSMSRSFLSLDVAPPTAAEQYGAWQSALADVPEAPTLAGELAAQFSLDLATIDSIAAAVRRKDSSDPIERRLWDECCLVLRPRLDTLAQRIDAKATWDDLVLPIEQSAALRQIVANVRGRHTVYEEWGFADRLSRGLGISALFAGDSGTGKTMAAEVISNDLRLPLYRIDLSAVVSKYIGETEKNLRQLFDAADLGGFILFFDEADALFGKRSEVRDSHDRYANIEVNYLLQRIEAYRGLAILASNAKAALDSAFVRRLRFIVDFPHPDPASRKRMWQRAFTAKTPIDDLDFDAIAKINATGGTIHNASLSAAFAATAGGGRVSTRRVLSALKAEYRKLNRPINESDFKVPEDAAPAAT